MTNELTNYSCIFVNVYAKVTAMQSTYTMTKTGILVTDLLCIEMCLQVSALVELNKKEIDKLLNIL